jgi:protein-tyrosine phosphatase
MPAKWGSFLNDHSDESSSKLDQSVSSVDGDFVDNDDATTESSRSNSQRSALALSRRLSPRRLMRKRPRVPPLAPSSLFNRLQTSSLTVVDCRSAADFAAGHVRGALHCEHGRRSRHKTVDDVLASCGNAALVDKLRARDMMEIVVIGSNRTSSSLLSRLDGGFRLAKLLLREGRVFSVYFLAQGFHAFASKYPFMLQKPEALVSLTSSSVSTTTSGSPHGSVKSHDREQGEEEDADEDHEDEEDEEEGEEGEEEVVATAPTTVTTITPPSTVLQYPNEILPGFLFLGNFWQANNAQIIADLGITHIVNMGAITDDRNKFDHVTYLDVDIPDRESVDIRKEFSHTVAFIQRAAPHGRVLIHCVQGVSRSSTIVIWYLMLETKCTLSAAYSYVLARRPLIFPNRGFMEQLMANEKDLYGVESVLPQELDLLQHGLLPPLDRKGSALPN